MATTGIAEIASFSEPVLAHLKAIYESLCHNGPEPHFNSVQNDADSGQDRLTSLASFLTYMASPAARANHTAEASDLSARISHYYISSSHNTYLTGNQLYSQASAAAYTNVLLRGCRCLEIDVWDGLSRSSSVSSSSSFHESNENRPLRQTSVNGHSRMKSLSNGVRQLVKRAASTRSSKHPTLSHAQMLQKTNSKTGEAGGSGVLCEPRVLHGHTLTKEVSFRDVCYAIRDNAFVGNDLPVIVSLEVHAGLEQQQMMVDIMREAWKGYLVEIETGENTDLPRLQDLRRKILIKVKWSPHNSKVAEGVAHTEEKTEELESGVRKLDIVGEDRQDSQSKQKASKILHALGELAVYTRAFHFSHFTQKEATMPTHVFSLSETAVKDAHAKSNRALLDHNREFLMRVYPSGIRVNSSNLDPTFFWQQGAQMVALNWQNCDKGMMINDAMFPDGAGWAMKPSLYRAVSSGDGCSNVLLGDAVQTVDLSIEIYAGQQIRHPDTNSTSGNNFHLYIICQLHLCKAEEALSATDEPGQRPKQRAANEENDTKKYKLRSKTSTGIDPDFKGERFKIKDDEFGRDSLAAWACIRLDRLKQGYRFLHLKNGLGQPSGMLLVKINKKVSKS
ncbi:PLC-like phosphodiesterase [Talaromyces proteolyticus]|uniref:Phosphoinositide phospholipase C n=1 Tax=Talaromyces proteolyticus TaxID=1131652 RepID=A0AAD4PXZ3_9EURO|nr:PLC-like phosphodiesterase [Talaromyces proteolyticus]KAH8694075.1 PLC-like phosphodiesterase [Talaromyces proteolyticus]